MSLFLRIAKLLAGRNICTIRGTDLTVLVIASWCNAQYSSCGTLCGGTPSVNNCTAVSFPLGLSPINLFEFFC